MMYRFTKHLRLLMVALLLAGSIAFGAFAGMPAAIQAQEATPAAPIEPPAEDPPVVEDTGDAGEQPPPADTEDVTEEPESSTDMPPTPEAGNDGGEPPPATDETLTDDPAPVPALTYALAGQPKCRPVDAQLEVVAHGGALAYACTASVHLNGARLAPAAVLLDWTVAATVEGGWSVQLQPPVLDPVAPPAWTAADSPTAEFIHQSGAGDGAATDPLETFEATTTLAFGLRAHRVACGTDAQPVTVKVAVAPSLPGVDAVTITDANVPRDPYTLNPALAPIPEPAIAFAGALNFGEIRVDATGVLEPPAPQTIDLVVSGLDQACGDWSVGLSLNSPAAAPAVDDGTGIASAPANDTITLSLVTIDGATIADGGCPLAGGCTVAVLATGAAVASSATITLGVSLVLPDQPRATTFNSTLTATLMDTTA